MTVHISLDWCRKDNYLLMGNNFSIKSDVIMFASLS